MQRTVSEEDNALFGALANDLCLGILEVNLRAAEGQYFADSHDAAKVVTALGSLGCFLETLTLVQCVINRIAYMARLIL